MLPTIIGIISLDNGLSHGKASMSWLDFLENAAKGSLCQEIVVRAEQKEPCKAMDFNCDSIVELIFYSPFGKFGQFL